MPATRPARALAAVSCLLACCAAVPVTSAGEAGPAAPPAPTVVRPAGAYHLAWLDLSAAGVSGRLFLSFRAGKGVQCWALGSLIPGGPKPAGLHSLVCDENTLVLDGTAVKGSLKLRLVSSWGPAANLGSFTMTLAGAIAGGTYAVEGDKSGKAAGQFKGSVVADSDLARSMAFTPGKGWPGFLGSGDAGRGSDSGRALVDDPAKIRHLWRSEETTLTGWGNTADGRYATNVMYNALGGGASSAISQDGRIYLYYHSPNKASAANEQTAALLAKARTLSSDPHELDLAERFHAARSDVVVVCIDGITGKTLWKSTWPLKQGNFQTHKWRGMNPTPAVADGMLYVTDYNNRSYAHDAATGELKWEYGDLAGGFAGNRAWRGPVVAGGVVILGGAKTVGLDARTGKQVWAAGASTFHKLWTSGGRTCVLLESSSAKSGDKEGGVTTCLDAATGAQMWTATHGMRVGNTETPMVIGDTYVGYSGGEPAVEILAYRLSAKGMEKAWTAQLEIVDRPGIAGDAAAGAVYLSGSKEVRCCSLADGTVLGTAAVGGARTHHLQVVDGRVILDPEGRHGTTKLFFLRADPKAFALLGGEWSGGYPATTAYANMPIFHTIDDGRLFMRGRDGIYGFDLRTGQ